jgi:hypothetical protein
MVMKLTALPAMVQILGERELKVTGFPESPPVAVTS